MFAKFHSNSDEEITLDMSRVESICNTTVRQGDYSGTLITMHSGKSHTVTEPYAEVNMYLDAMLEAHQEEPDFDNDKEFLTIPVLLNFDQDQNIGAITLERSKLPPTPNYVFSLGYMATQFGANMEFTEDTKHALVCVSLIPDDNYIALLRKDGKI